VTRESKKTREPQRLVHMEADIVFLPENGFNFKEINTWKWRNKTDDTRFNCSLQTNRDAIASHPF
jgi:hypothetical protein